METPGADAGFDTLTLATGGGVAIVTLRRPESLNTFTGAMMRDLLRVFDVTDEDDSVRAVILTGAGRAFCAGADLSNGSNTFDYAAQAAAGRAGDLGETGDGRDSGGRVTLRMFRSLKPVICAINGDAVGIGATMTLAADIRIAAASARLGFVFSRRGVVPEACSSWFLPRLVGISTALDWCYSGRLIAADEARDAGLLRSVHPPEDLLDAARAIAETYQRATSPVSVAMTRLMLWRMLGAAGPEIAHELDSAAMIARGASEDAREGIASFLERRAPSFPDRVSVADLSILARGEA